MPLNLHDRLRRFADGDVDAIILSRADARYLAELVDDDNETVYVSNAIREDRIEASPPDQDEDDGTELLDHPDRISLDEMTNEDMTHARMADRKNDWE